MRMRVTFPVHSGFTQLHLEWCAPFSTSHFKEDVNHPEESKENDPESTKPDLLGRTEGIVGICSTREREREREGNLQVCKRGALHLCDLCVSLMQLIQNC